MGCQQKNEIQLGKMQKTRMSGEMHLNPSSLQWVGKTQFTRVITEGRQDEAGKDRGQGELINSVHLLSSRYCPNPARGTQENREPKRPSGGEDDANPIFPEERALHTVRIL